MSEPDWLSVEGDKAASDQRAAAMEIESLYSVFATDDRARRLLDMWTEQVESRDVLPNASHAEYAYYEARRAFVQGIRRHMKIATTMRGT